MCLISTGRRKIAKEDIVCYKVLLEGPYGTITSPHYEYHWTVGAEEVITDNKGKKKGLINDGFFHTFIDEKFANLELFYIKNFCSRKNIEANFGIYKCVIPKGAVYYSGYHPPGGDGYASKRLKLIGKI